MNSLSDTLVNLRTLVGQARMLGASDDEILTRVVFALLRTRPHAEVVARLVKLLDVLHADEAPTTPGPCMRGWCRDLAQHVHEGVTYAGLDLEFDRPTPAPFDGPLEVVEDPTFEDPDHTITIPANPRTTSPELRSLLRDTILRNRISSFAPALGGRAPELADALVDELIPIIASVDANAHARGRAEALDSDPAVDRADL